MTAGKTNLTTALINLIQKITHIKHGLWLIIYLTVYCATFEIISTIELIFW